MYTLTFNGNSSNLSCDFYPPIEVSKNAKICLLSLQTTNSIPNINDECNSISIIDKNEEVIDISLPTGAYEMNDLEEMLREKSLNIINDIRLRANKITLKCEIYCSSPFYFKNNGIGKILGFKLNTVYFEDKWIESETIVNITKVNCINIDSNLVAGSFHNGIHKHTLHEFYPNVPPGYKINEVPRHLVFYSLNCTSISHAEIVLKDQNGEIINLRGEPLTVRLLIQDN